MSPRRSQMLLSGACGFSLVALGLIVWSLFDPRPFPVVAAMSIGQAIGTLSFAAFGYVAIADLRARLRPSSEAAAKAIDDPTARPQ